MEQSGSGYSSLLATLKTALPETGWAVIPQAFSAEQSSALRHDLLELWRQGEFHAAGIGSGQQKTVNAGIRGDAVRWLEPQDSDTYPAIAAFQDFLEILRLELNRELMLGLFESEAHFAIYPPGGFYQRHVDNFRGSSARLVTFILYLNENWQPGDGGELRLFVDAEDGGRSIDIAPESGKLVVFMSEQFYHEVLPARSERLSVTGWLRRRS